jgi:AraC-like DNA-binding protein
MSTPVAVFHGAFGRVCLYSMDRPMVPHAHREGHLIFHVQGPPASIVVDGKASALGPGQAAAVSPWQTHYYTPLVGGTSVVALVLYIRPGWFLEASRRSSSSLHFGRVGIEVTDHLARLVTQIASSMLDQDLDDPLMAERLCTLTQSSFDQSWQWTDRGSRFAGAYRARHDFRIRKALALMTETMCDAHSLDELATEVGLSRPHFYKLFREQVGVTPNIYLNSLRMERAIEQLTTTAQPVSDIGYDIGFSSQASFSRFFIANGVVSPSAYRRSVHVSSAG